MDNREIKKENVKEEVIAYLSDMYKRVGTSEGYGYLMNNGYIVRVAVCNDESFMLEYAGNMEEVETNYFEDGEWFHYEDFNTEKGVVDAVVKELQYYEVHG